MEIDLFHDDYYSERREERTLLNQAALKPHSLSLVLRLPLNSHNQSTARTHVTFTFTSLHLFWRLHPLAECLLHSDASRVDHGSAVARTERRGKETVRYGEENVERSRHRDNNTENGKETETETETETK